MAVTGAGFLEGLARTLGFWKGRGWAGKGLAQENKLSKSLVEGSRILEGRRRGRDLGTLPLGLPQGKVPHLVPC